MARQLDVATHSLRCLVRRRQQIYTSSYSRIFFSSVSSSQPPSSHTPTPSNNAVLVHQSLVTTAPNLLALQRVQQLLQQPQSRVLLLTGSGASGSTLRAELERDTSVFELERRGHGIFGVREFCRLLLRESGRERRVFGRAQLAALLLHHSDTLSSSTSRFAAVSTLQRRKRVQDLLQLFWLLEREGVAPEQYAAVAGDSLVAQELAESYAKYQELLMQHNATSWDGLVMDVLAMCGVQKGEDAMTGEFSEGLLRQYTDVVVDDVQRTTPAMARLVGHLCAQPSVQSSASFSQVVLEGDYCLRTQILERQLLETSEHTGHRRTITQTTLKLDDETAEKRVKMQAFAQQLLTSKSDGGKSKKLSPPAVPSPVPLRCLRFSNSEAEEREIGAFIADTLKQEGATGITVLCPSYVDVHRITMAFRKQNLPVRALNNQFSGALNHTGAPVHLFDEPGVNTVYSLICALCFPSDSRHLYNVLRSDSFGFSPELLSWLMEKEHRSHADLFQVLEEFVESRGKSLFASLQNNVNVQGPPHAISLQLESGLETAGSFVAIIKRLRGECHKLSAAEIVHSFLSDTGRLETLLSPSSPEQERESLALAGFLRELETAQSVVNSTQVTFVAPYLQQLRETNLTSSVSWEQSSQEIDDDGLDSDAGKSCVRVLPLTARALELLEALVKGNGEDRRVLVLISMRDSKFPGRMKRLTLPLPYDVLSKPYPIQTRAEHLEHTEQLAYQAFTLDTYDEMVLSFAELAATKREVLSRTFKPIWHEEDQPTSNEGGTKGEGDGSNNITSSQCESSKQAPTALTVATIRAEPPLSASRFWYLEMAEFLRTFVNRVILPIWRQPKQLPIADVSSRIKCRRKTENKQDVGGNKGQKATSPVPEVPNGAQDSLLPTEKLTYEPPHLSYSQISEYLRCPHRYFLARVMKLGGDTSASMMFGRALHESVAAFATTLAAAQRRGDDVGNAKALAGVEAEEAFVRAWADDGFGLFSSKEQAQFLFDRGMLALWDFMDTHYENPQAQEILHVEREFSVYVPEANVELRGVWDRIDRVAHGDGSFFYVIKEFKSNMSGAERNMRKLADESLQLKLYMYAFRKVFGEAPHGAQLQQIGGSYPHADINTSKAAIRKTTRSGNEALVLFSDKAMQEAEAAVGKVALGLRCGDFGPTPSFAECAFCPYAGSACHFTTDDVSHEPRSARNKSSV